MLKLHEIRPVVLKTIPVQEVSLGAISSDEYKQLAAETTLAQVQQQAVKALGLGKHAEPRQEIAKAFAAAFHGQAQAIKGAALAQPTDSLNQWGADVSISDVHHYPLRAGRLRPGTGCCMSMPMRLQQETGRYPSVKDHLTGRTPAYKLKGFGLLTEYEEIT